MVEPNEVYEANQAAESAHRIGLLDRLGFKLVGALARLFGPMAAKSEEAAWFRTQVDIPAGIGSAAFSSMHITQEADFVCAAIHHVAFGTATGAIITDLNWQVKIVDAGSDRHLMEDFITRTNSMGQAQFPMYLQKHRLFKRNSDISFQWQNLSVPSFRVQLVFFGYKIYDASALNLTAKR